MAARPHSSACPAADLLICVTAPAPLCPDMFFFLSAASEQKEIETMKTFSHPALLPLLASGSAEIPRQVTLAVFSLTPSRQVSSPHCRGARLTEHSARGALRICRADARGSS